MRALSGEPVSGLKEMHLNAVVPAAGSASGLSFGNVTVAHGGHP